MPLGSMGLSSIEQLRALGILPPQQTPQLQPTPQPQAPLGQPQANPMPTYGDPMGNAAASPTQNAPGPGLGQSATDLSSGVRSLFPSAGPPQAKPLDAASAVQNLDALKAASVPDAPPSTTGAGLYGPQAPQQPPQGLYTPPQSAPATTPAQNPQAPPVTPQAPARPPVAPTGPAVAPPDASAPPQEAQASPATPQGAKYAPDQITAALIKAGVPSNDAATLAAVSGAESGYNPSAIGPKNKNGTTDYGLFQINSAHNDLNPTSLPGADLDTQAQAAAAVYKKEGLGAWSTYNNGSYKGFLGGGGGTPSSPSGNLAAAQGAMQGNPKALEAQGTDIGIHPDEIMQMAAKLGYQPTTNFTQPGDKLIAMGLGMMGGRTMADSFKGAGEAFQGMRGQDLGIQEKQNSNALSLAQVGINDARLGQQMRMQQAQNSLQNRKLDQQIEYQNGILKDRDQNTQNQTNRVNGVISGATPAAAAGAKEATADVQEIMDGQQQGTMQMQKINQIQKLLDSGQVSPGPTGAAQMKTALGNLLGVPINGADPNANQLLQQAISSTRGSGIMGKNMRTQREFDTVMQGLINFDKQGPEAMGQVLTSLKNIAQMRIQAGQEFYKLPADQQMTMRRDPIAASKFMQDQTDKWSETVNKGGGMYQSKDPNTGLGFTIH